MRTARILLMCFILSPLIAHAGDVGDLIFPADHPHLVRTEFIFESLQRRVEVTSERPRVRYTHDADVFALRFQSALNPIARVDIQGGTISGGGGSNRLMGGLGLRLLAFDHNAWRGASFAQFRYGNDVRSTVDLGPRTGLRARYDQIDGDAGFLFSHRYRLADELNVASYAGPAVSFVRLSGDVFEADGTRGRFRAKQNRLLGVVAGVGLHFRDMNAIRLETSFFGHFSVSAAAAIAF